MKDYISALRKYLMNHRKLNIRHEHSQIHEKVDWAAYKEAAAMVRIKSRAVPFGETRTTICLVTGNGDLDIGKLDDRRLIREVQRIFRSHEAFESLRRLFEGMVLETAAFAKSIGLKPDEKEFEDTVLDYGMPAVFALVVLEESLAALMPQGLSDLGQAEFNAGIGRVAGGRKN